MSKRNRLLGLGMQGLAALSGGAAGLLLLRLLFGLLIANPANLVTPIVHTLSQPLLFPWGRLWPPADLPGLAIDKAALAALGMYLVLGLLWGFLGQALLRQWRAAAPVRAGREER